jgi:hypothetical protein
MHRGLENFFFIAPGWQSRTAGASSGPACWRRPASVTIAVRMAKGLKRCCAALTRLPAARHAVLASLPLEQGLEVA